MNFKHLFTLSLFFVLSKSVDAQSDLIFKAGFEKSREYLNDTGIKWAGEYPSGNNINCTSSTITSPQDCNIGRDSDPLTNNNDDGLAGFSFTKLDINGTPLVNQSVDYTITSWSCVQDNVTGLVWEVKTTTADIHNKDNTYQWGGLTAIGRDHVNRQGVYYDPSWNELVQGSNTSNFCGLNNWRLPTANELTGLANLGLGAFEVAIDSNYFPNAASPGYWSSSPVAHNENGAWVVDVNGGYIYDLSRIFGLSVRLVHDFE